MSCEPIRRQLEEHLAVGIPADLLPGTLRAHLESCPACAAFADAARELNRLLEEPLPLPPPDLSQRVMAAVAREETRREPVSLAQTERLVWAALGAVSAWGIRDLIAGATLGVQSLWQSASATLAGWTAALEALKLPVLGGAPVDVTFALWAAAGLMGVQFAILWRARQEAVR
ncbi:MAG: hypothetical protein HY319_30955 [Armatimonadetes bacterium]|nr:hypothetical protein [Armatimonadota bacterium]